MQIFKIIVLISLAVISLILASNAIPIMLALVTAILLEPIVKLWMRWFRMNRLFSVATTFILFLLFFGAFTYWASTVLIVQSMGFAQRLPALSQHFFDWAESYVLEWEHYYATLPPETVYTIQQVLLSLKNSAITFATSITRWLFSSVAVLPELLLVSLVYLVGLFLISLDLPKIRIVFLRLFSRSAREKVELVLNELTRAFVGFVGAQLVLSLLTFLITVAGLMILKVKYVFVISLLIVLVDILPILGTGSFLVPWAAYSYLALNNTHLAIGLVILFLVITVFRRTIEPKILGTSLGISALAALTSLYIGFQLLGFIGMILGPAVVIIYEALRKAGFLKVKINF